MRQLAVIFENAPRLAEAYRLKNQFLKIMHTKITVNWQGRSFQIGFWQPKQLLFVRKTHYLSSEPVLRPAATGLLKF